MIKALFRSAIAIAVVLTARQAVFAGRDLVRYNAMREMSGDPPFPVGNGKGKKPETNAEARTTNPLAMLLSIPSDVQRYLKMRAM
jgi:hypothetical protein